MTTVNAPLLSALMRQWGQRVDQALTDDLRWTDRPALAAQVSRRGSGHRCDEWGHSRSRQATLA